MPGRFAQRLERRLAWLTVLAGRLGDGLPAARRRDERGDVNGYVFITLMTAGIVMVLWVIARDRLSEVFDRAISSVVGP